MIVTATETDGTQIQDITARAGVFSQEEIDSVPEMFNEYLTHGAEGSGYHFIVYRENDQVLGFAIYGFRDLTDGVYDLYWIAVDPNARCKGIGIKLLTASEEAGAKWVDESLLRRHRAHSFTSPRGSFMPARDIRMRQASKISTRSVMIW